MVVVPVRGRSPGRIAWTRLRRDRAAVAGASLIVFMILTAVFAPLIVGWFGQPPNEFHQDLIDPRTLAPAGGTGISGQHLLGIEPVNGRDLFSRVVYGSRISLLIALPATLLSVVVGTVTGLVAGFFGGWTDALLSRTMEAFLALPVLVFALAMVGVLSQFEQRFALKGDALRVSLLIVVIGSLSWPYVGRIVRAQTLSLREREFVEAARCLGAGPAYVLSREILPNLAAPILVYSTLLIPTNILLEAGLSFLGVGVQPPTATWGGMLADAVRFYNLPHFMLPPGMAIFVCVLAFNLFGDGLRDAFDPKST